MSDSCEPMDCNLPGSSVHGISQAIILEWVAVSISRGSSWPRNWTQVSCTAGRFATDWATREACSFFRASLVAQRVKRLPAMWEAQVRSLGWEGLLEKEMATHSSILAWRIPWMEEPSRLQSMGPQRVGHDWATSPYIFGEVNGNSLQYSCLENPMVRGAWWATVHGVTKSQTGQVISRSLSPQTRNSLRVEIYVFLPV